MSFAIFLAGLGVVDFGGGVEADASRMYAPDWITKSISLARSGSTGRTRSRSDCIDNVRASAGLQPRARAARSCRSFIGQDTRLRKRLRWPASAVKLSASL